ncbi:TonB-dependent receptor [Caulobacter sp. NIBR2454]|uniref:TonB-dependent receptor n=1 Tax=Caulobacter sp. NIBR2454 TaxID=3015996 RepID=UPI0022B605A6|nr:TonB-dependent receptor [Caulobacter sp. NIBR2454]
MSVRILFGAASLAALSTAAMAEEAPGHDVSEVVITAAPYAVEAGAMTASVAVVTRQDLDLAPQAGLGEVLAGMPGLRSTAFGAGASRPVVRGLSGPRVLVLNNGVGMIDASALSPDHQVASDPGEAERIEVLRGPSALAYGGSAIGGVVNVIDERIPTHRPEKPEGRVNVSGATVDDSYSASAAVRAAAGPLVFSLDGLKRKSDDYEIPVPAESVRQILSEGEFPESRKGGKLENTAVDLEAYGAGVSYVGAAGYLGVAVKHTDTSYGVPGHSHEHEHEHEEGEDHDHEEHEEEAPVTIGLKQTRVDLRGEYDGAFGPFAKLKFSGGWADYKHTEFEGDEVGTRFLSDGVEGRLDLVQAERDGWKGAVGFQALRRDFDAQGDEAYVPKTRITEFGAFTQQRVDKDGWGYEGGLRVDQRKLDSLAGERDFTNISGSVGAFLKPSDAWFFGVALSRNGRAPTEAELFANGPHVATRGFEIGNPDLDSEIAYSLEATLHYGGDRLDADLHLFAAKYDGFIDARPTGEEEDGLAVFAYEQTDADFHGFEAEVSYRLWEQDRKSFTLEAGADYVRGDTDLGAPARIPPYSVSVRGIADSPHWGGKLEVRQVGKQTRVAEFELPTDAYTVLNARVSYKPFGDPRMEFYIDGRNLTDAEVREHTSFLKDIAPSPGRSVRGGVAWRF